MENNESEMIFYGDKIFLGDPLDNNSFFFTDGFTKSKLILKNFNLSKNRINFNRCLFQIFPSFSNTFKKEAADLIERKNDEKVSKSNLHELKEKLSNEYKFNLKSFEKYKNIPVNYGKNIQFLHVASNKFLSVEFDESDLKNNFTIHLNDISSENTLFKFEASFKYQKESEGKL